MVEIACRLCHAPQSRGPRPQVAERMGFDMKRWVLLGMIWAVLASGAWAAESGPTPLPGSAVEVGVAALERGHFATALRAWKQAADAGNPKAQANVGYMYERGFGVPQSYVEALRWYRMAAAGGAAEGMYNIGTLYYYGYGVERNPREAANWFRQAAKKQLPEAQYLLALMYSEGEGVPRSAQEALRWWVAAAKQGHLSSQLMAAHTYLSGDATRGEPDLLKAFVWGEIAAARGNQDASLVRDYASYQMKEDAVAAARQAAKVCQDSQYARCPAW